MINMIAQPAQMPRRARSYDPTPVSQETVTETPQTQAPASNMVRPSLLRQQATPSRQGAAETPQAKSRFKIPAFLRQAETEEETE